MVSQSKTTSRVRRSGAATRADDNLADWFSVAHEIIDAFERAGRTETDTWIQWLKKYSKDKNRSTNTLRRLPKLVAFSDQLVKDGVISHASDVKGLDHTKLETVLKIWGVDWAKAHELVRQMLQNASPSLNELRALYKAICLEKGVKLKPKGAAQISSRSNLNWVLKGIYKIEKMADSDTVIALPGKQAFRLVVVDAVLGIKDQENLIVQSAILVARSNEVVNKASSLSFLARICYVARFFDSVWVVGEKENFPLLRLDQEGVPEEDQDVAETKITTLDLMLKELNVRNVGIIEVQDEKQEVRKWPDVAAPSSNDTSSYRGQLMPKSLPPSLFRPVSV